MTPRDSHGSDLGEGRQNRRRGPVTRVTAAGQRDKDMSPSDRDDRPTPQANESRYGSAPAAVPRLQRPGWTHGDNQAIHPTLTRPDLVAITPEQRKQIVAVLTSMILDFVQRRERRPRVELRLRHTNSSIIAQGSDLELPLVGERPPALLPRRPVRGVAPGAS
ncbi:hypothetical protein [Actinoplanes sp. NBRC 103695]|uniref:hypothetical protein n=1 Tax=Actinoplanes sp. NBRC 103695 TaxID=3032202 RepID=UPI0024A34A24|nr:hypothetical protein [Actinoplanes sp. NBRC 103695]GLZ02332.1 hypothetical protein Acsp02_95830 [Actinoplanes sp. NBRC 103695]